MNQSDEGKRRKEVAEASKANQLLENETFAGAVNTLRAYYEASWRASAPDAQDGREQLWWMLRSLDAVIGQLCTVVDTGKLAEKELETLDKLSGNQPKE